MTSLLGTLPTTRAAYTQLQQYALTQGITIGVADYGGLRTQGDTATILTDRVNDFNAEVAAGEISADTTLDAFRPIAPFGSSFHNYGAAFDVAILSTPAGMSGDRACQVLGAYAPSIGLRWGGTFSNPDPVHFELAVALSAARTMWGQFSGTTDPAGGTAADGAVAMDGAEPDESGEGDIESSAAAGDILGLDPALFFGLAFAGLLAFLGYHRARHTRQVQSES
jgi:hypothetical protein